MSMNEFRRDQGRDRNRDRDRRGRPEYRLPYYNQYPYGQQCPYAQPYQYGQQYPYGQPYQYGQPATCPSGQCPYTQPGPSTPQLGTCPQGSMSYTVQSGDTLENISSRLGVSSSAITTINPAVNFSVPLQVGQSICLPVGNE